MFSADVPVFGICYGFQAMAQALGGTVTRTGNREYGGTPLRPRLLDPGVLLRDLPADLPVWMSHGDCVTEAPEGFTVTAESAGAPVAAFEDLAGRRAGVQFHPEVGHTAHGQEMLTALPLRHRRHRADLDAREHHRRAGRPDPRPDR